jgi:hypothetical protein
LLTRRLTVRRDIDLHLARSPIAQVEGGNERGHRALTWRGEKHDRQHDQRQRPGYPEIGYPRPGKTRQRTYRPTEWRRIWRQREPSHALAERKRRRRQRGCQGAQLTRREKQRLEVVATRMRNTFGRWGGAAVAERLRAFQVIPGCGWNIVGRRDSILPRCFQRFGCIPFIIADRYCRISHIIA